MTRGMRRPLALGGLVLAALVPVSMPVSAGGGDPRDCDYFYFAETDSYQIIGTPDPDVCDGTSTEDFADMKGGSDTFTGGLGQDQILGAGGADTLKGQSGADTIKGEDGNDKLYDGPGSDDIYGGAGTDTWFKCSDGYTDNAVNIEEVVVVDC